MPNQAMSCSPSVYTDENGMEVVDYNNPTFNTRSGFHSDDADFNYNDSTGEVTHNTPVDTDHPAYQEQASSDEYFAALSEAFPLAEMDAWAGQNWSPDRINDFNALIEEGDYEKVNLALEQLRDEMLSTAPADTESHEDGSDFSNEQVEEIEAAYPVEELQQYLADNYPESIEAFDAIVNSGTYDQVQGLYQALYEDYLETQ